MFFGSSKQTVCICGAGNAAHVFIPYFTKQGFDVTVHAPFKDEAERLQKGVRANGGITIHDRQDPENVFEYKGSPKKISKNAADVVPQADYIIAALPSFAIGPTLKDIKNHLKNGSIIFVMPGQGGADFVAREVLKEELASGKTTMAGVVPMPLNCRITEWGNRVELAALKHSYDIATVPSANAQVAADAFAKLMDKKCKAIGNYVGIGLHCSNPNLHPGRLYRMWSDYYPGKVYPENVLFYETWDDESTDWLMAINDERLKIWKTIVEKYPETGKIEEVPDMFTYIKDIYGPQVKDPSTFTSSIRSCDGYKGFKCPMKAVEGGFVPDFENRYFTEDIPEGVCMYKGIADLAGVATPVMDRIVTFFQKFMGKEYIKDGKLIGADLGETKSPQRFGVTNLEQLLSDSAGTVCICGAGNAAHVFIPYFTKQGFNVTVYAPFQDEAERLQKGVDANGGITIHDRQDPKNTFDYKFKPAAISANAADVVPQADYIIAALPSFAIEPTLTDIKPHLKQGSIIFVMPGQGGADFVAREVLKKELKSGKTTMAGVVPMPLNCRITEWGKRVELAALKQSYDLATVPAKNAQVAAAAFSKLMGKPCKAIGNYVGIGLHCSNPNLHPGRLYRMWSDYTEGKVYPENVLFYETWDDESTAWLMAINDERLKIWRTIVEKYPQCGKVEEVPDMFTYIKDIYGSQVKDPSTFTSAIRTCDGYKGFKCPMKEVEGGFVPDFKNRYFTEDIPEGVCMYKGIADLAGVETPVIDEIVCFFQEFMGKEYIVDGKLKGKDVMETKSPQRYGVKSLGQLLADGDNVLSLLSGGQTNTNNQFVDMGKSFTSVNVPFQANTGFSTIGSSYSGFSAQTPTIASSYRSNTIPFQANKGYSTPYSATLASSLTTAPSSFNSTTIPFQANRGMSLASGISAPYSTSVASSYPAQQVNLAGDNAGSRFYEKYSAERDRQYRSAIDKTATLYQQSNLGQQVSGSYSAPLSSMASSFNSTSMPFQATRGISTPTASSFTSTTIPFQANTGLSASYSTPLASSFSSASIPLQANFSSRCW
jgi:ketopantoate reductase